MKYPVNKLVVYDLEILPNMFMFGALHKGKVHQFIDSPFNQEASPFDQIKVFLREITAEGYILCGFNNQGYDDLVLYEYLTSSIPQKAYQTSREIIEGDLKRWQTDCNIESVDLMRILPGRMSLKKLGIVLGHDRLHEMLIDWNKEATPELVEEILPYNVNDLHITKKLLDELQPQLDLRAQMSDRYDMDLRSMGEAAIAEQVLLHETGNRRQDLKNKGRNEIDAHPTFNIRPPSWWDEFATSPNKEIIEIGEAVFATPITIRDYQLPSMARTVYIGDRYYQMGVGGLHSVDGAGCWKPGKGESMVDWDVTAYYPSMIITQGLQPFFWGESFLPAYKSLVDRRVAAKQAGDKVTDAVLKIVINGSFGKFGDQYSTLFDPEMLAHVTLYGQLGLLALIAMLTDAGHRVVSANTDGVTVISDYNMVPIIRKWERLTGLNMEATPYHALYQSNINNYTAITTQGVLKTKGRLASKPDLRKLPRALIVPYAVNVHLLNAMPIVETIQRETDINRFILAGTVNYGWKTWCGEQQLGKVLRWYRSATEGLPQIMKAPTNDDIKGNAGQVPYSENGVPVDDLPDSLPDDLDLNWYIEKAYDLLEEISRPKLTGMNAFAEELIAQGLQPNVVEQKKQLSRASVERGTVDFDSIPAGHHMVVRTGNGLVAEMRGGQLFELIPVDKVYPAKTRAKIDKDHGFTLIHGGSVPVPPWGVDIGESRDLDCWYTPSELKAARSK